MYLYHATNEEFSQFIIDSSYTSGTGGEDYGVGIYFFPESESPTKHLKNVLKRKYSGKKEFISINGSASCYSNVYIRALTFAKGFDDVSIKTVISEYKERKKRKLSKKELMDGLHNWNVPQEKGERVADFFADKDVYIGKCPVPFKGRVLKVKVADDAKIWKDGKTLVENGYMYDFGKVWSLLEAHLPDNAEKMYDFFRKITKKDYICQKAWNETRLFEKKSNIGMAKILEMQLNPEHFHPEFSTESEALKKERLLLIAEKQKLTLKIKQLLKSAIDGATDPYWMEKLSLDENTKQKLRMMFPCDGKIFYNDNVYGSDIYVIRNPAVLTIEAYKPYGSDKWIPVEQPKKKELTLTERLARFRNGGIEA